MNQAIKNNADNVYLNLLKNVLDNGVKKPNRTGIDAISTFGQSLRFDLSKGFPLLTTKKIHFKSVVHELLWFLRGESNIKYLKDNGVRIWDEWADKDGYIGPIYGPQWRCCPSIEWIKKQTFNYEDPKIVLSFKEIEPDYSNNSFDMIGKVYKSNNYGEFRVIKEYSKEEKKFRQFVFDIQFLRTNYILKKVLKRAIVEGSVKDKYLPNVCGVACVGEIKSKKNHDLLKDLWQGMINRCYNKNHTGYENYGGRGIFVDSRWLIYANFLEDAVNLPNWLLKKEFPDKYSLDKDFCGSNKYSKDTCVWASKKEQSYNTRQNKAFLASSPSNDEYIWYGISFFADRYGFSECGIGSCINNKTDSHKDWEFKEYFDKNDYIPRLRIIDQVHELIANIKNDPDSRRLIISAWNPTELKFCKLAPCHILATFNVTDNKLSCAFVMRSCDVFLGLPFNIASYALLTHLIAHVCGLEVGELIWTGHDVHIYENHIEQVKIQLERVGHSLPKIVLDTTIKDIDDFQYHNINLDNYISDPLISAKVAV